MYRLVFFTLLGIVAMFGVAQVAFRLALPADAKAEQAAAPAVAASPSSAPVGDFVIKRDDSGQFFVNAEANGHDTQFLIDTGADFVALSVTEAENLGVEFDPSSFEPITKTASGVGMGQKVTIGHLMVAEREFRDVEALVVEGLETNLLGQSLLTQLGHIEIKGDEIVIRGAA